MIDFHAFARGRALRATGRALAPLVLSLSLAGLPAPRVAAGPTVAHSAISDASGVVSVAAASAAAPKAYVGLFQDNAVAVIDTAANQVLTTIPVPAGPHGLVVTPDGGEVFVSSDGASTVSVIDTATDRVETSVDVGQAPHGLALTPDGREVWSAVFGANQVAVIDAERYTVLAQIPVPQPHNIAISPDGKRAYVASQQSGATALAVVDVAQRLQTGAVALNKTPRALSFDPGGTRLYFTLAGEDAVQVLDTATNQIVGSVPVGVSPHLPLLDGAGSLGLVVSQGPGELDLFSPASAAVSTVVPVGTLPHWIALGAEDKTAYVTNEGSNDVSVVDLTDDRVTATIPVGHAPRKIVVQPTPGASTAAAPSAGASTDMSPGTGAAAPAAAGADGPPAAAPASDGMSVPAGQGITIAGFAFAPNPLTVAPGQQITWTNADAVPHNVTSDTGAWPAADVGPGQGLSLTLTQPGTYAYHCAIHPFMSGTLDVRQ